MVPTQQVRDRLGAWWRGEPTDRVILQVTAPADSPDPAPRRTTTEPWTGWNLVHHLDDPGPAIDAFEACTRGTWFGGEAFPSLWLNFGPGVIAAFLGVEPRIADQTVWFEEPRDWDRTDAALRYDPANRWLQRVRRATADAAARCVGRSFPGMTDLGGELDVLASLRGTEALLIDLATTPDRVAAAAARLSDLWWQYYRELHTILEDAGHDGASSWLGVWTPGTGYPLQCDFAAMISPGMFREFVAPHLRTQCRRLDVSVYHLDGPGQIAHLDALLEIPELTAIQWIPGAGQPPLSSPDWLPMYEKILSAGKRLLLQWMDPAEVEPVLRALPADAILITTATRTEADGRLLLDDAARRSRARRRW